jgi:hypothetical protein
MAEPGVTDAGAGTRGVRAPLEIASREGDR